MKKHLFLICALFVFITTSAQTVLTTSSTVDKSGQNYSKVKGLDVLWSQEANSNGFASQDFEEAMTTYDCQAADDFVVSMGPWSISSLSCFGSYTTGGPLEYVNVYFYNNDSGIPGDLIVEFLAIPCSTEVKSGEVSIDLPETVELEDGTYWVSIVARMDHNPYGQWYWHAAVTNNGEFWHWRNPDDGFGMGVVDWTSGQTVFGSSNRDMSVSIYGYAPNMIFANCVANNQKAGKYYLGATAWSEVNIMGALFVGATDINGVLYGLDFNRNFGYFDETMTTWTQIGPTGIAAPLHLLNLTYDPVDEKIYTIGLVGPYPDFDFSLYSIDKTTGVGTLVATETGGGTIVAIAADLFGNLYAVKHIPGENGEFYLVDKTDASLILIGDMGLQITGSYQSMAFDFKTNRCFFQGYGSAPQMNGTYLVDVVTGIPTRFGEDGFIDQILGIGIPYDGDFYSVIYSVYGSNGSVYAEALGTDFDSGSKLTEGTDVTFTAIPNSGYKVKVWSVNGSQQPGTSNIFNHENLQGNIVVTVEFQPATAVDEISINDLKVFPNPFVDEVFITNTSSVTRLIVSNLVGVTIMDIQITGDVTISTASFSKGLYLLNFTTIEGSQVVKKIVKL